MKLHTKLMAGAALALTTGLMVAPSQAAAQATCDGGGQYTGFSGDTSGEDDGAFDFTQVACGYASNTLSGTFNTAIGTGADASGRGDGATAVGARADANSFGAHGPEGGDVQANSAFGTYANASGRDASNTALGTAAQAYGANSRNVAIGIGSTAAGDGSQLIAIGDATAANLNSVAIGDTTNATGLSSVAVGPFANALGERSVAIGNGSTANEANTFAVGGALIKRRIVNVANGIVADGSTDAVTGDQLFDTNARVGNAETRINALEAVAAPPISSNNALGYDAPTSTGENSVATGWGAESSGGFSVANGWSARSVGYASTAMGEGSYAGGASSAAFGASAGASGEASVATGTRASALGARTIAVGSDARAGMDDGSTADAVAIGAGTRARGVGSVALGAGSIADEANVVSVGSADNRRRIVNVGDGTIATGSSDAVTGGQLFATNQAVATAQATADQALGRGDALGQSVARNLGGGAAYDPATGAVSAPSYAVGTSNYANVGAALNAANTSGLAYFHTNGTAPDGSATGTNATAIGSAAASGTNAVAIGNGAQASAANAVAIGSGSVASEANTVSVGSASVARRVVYVAAGTSATDAVNLGQLGASGASVAAALGGGSVANAAGIITAPTYNVAGGRYTNVGGALTGLSNLAFDIRKEARSGIAAATAMGTAPFPSAPGRTSYVANVAEFNGEVAFGAAIAHRLNTETDMALTAGYSRSTAGGDAFKVGVAGEF